MSNPVTDRLRYVRDVTLSFRWIIGLVIALGASSMALIRLNFFPQSHIGDLAAFHGLARLRLGWWIAAPLALACAVKLELSFREKNRGDDI
jgi:hypothetical protein